jgi:chaperonin cofactor prefoldin
MEPNERERLITQIDTLNANMQELTKAKDALQEANRELIKVLQEVDWLLRDARNLTKPY